MSEVLVTPAVSEADREAVFRLRYETYVEEMGFFRDSADHARRLLTDEYDEDAELLLASDTGQPVGTMRINIGPSVLTEEYEAAYDLSRWCPEPVPAEVVMVCSKFAVRRDHRRGMVPFELLRGTVQLGLARDVELVFADCQPHLVTVYTALGFRSYRPAYTDPHVAVTVPLVLVPRDVGHLRAVRSPLLSAGLADARPTPLTEAALARLPTGSVVNPAEGLRTLSTSVLDELTESEREAVLARGQVLTFAAGDPLIARGHGTRTMYVVLEGSFDVLTVAGNRVMTVTAGQVIGEIAFLLNRERTLDVRAASETAQVLALSAGTLGSLVEERGPIAAKLLYGVARTLAERLTAMDEAFAGPG